MIKEEKIDFNIGTETLDRINLRLDDFRKRYSMDEDQKNNET